MKEQGIDIDNISFHDQNMPRGEGGCGYGCLNDAEFLCDFPVRRSYGAGYAQVFKAETCDTPICKEHAKLVGPDKHHCPYCAGLKVIEFRDTKPITVSDSEAFNRRLKWKEQS